MRILSTQYLNKHVPVLVSSKRPFWFIWEGYLWKWIFVIGIHPVLHVLEDGVEELHALAGEQT